MGLKGALEIRDRAMADQWQRFNTQSLLGAALAGQSKPGAEDLLRSGYEGMKQRESRIPVPDRKHIKEAAERLAQFYEATGKPNDAAALRAQMFAPTTSRTTAQ